MPQLANDLLERRYVRLQVGELLLPSSPVPRFPRSQALGEPSRIEVFGAGLLLEDRLRRLDADALAHDEPMQLRESDRFGATLECSAQKRDRVGDPQPDESRSTTGALTPSWSATRVMAPRVIIA